MLAVCEKCQKTIVVEESGWCLCKYCQKRVWVPDPQDPASRPPEPEPEPVPEITVPEMTSSQAEPELEVPWEVGGAWPVKRFLATVGQALLRSRLMFGRLPEKVQGRQALWYGILVLGAGLMMYFQMQAVSLDYLRHTSSRQSPAEEVPPIVQEMIQSMDKMKMDSRFFHLSALFAPGLAAIMLFGTYHLFLAGYILFTGRGPASRQRVFRLVAYSYTPWLLIAIPVFGMIWFLVVQYHALSLGLKLSRRVSIFMVGLNLLLLNFLFYAWNLIYATLA